MEHVVSRADLARSQSSPSTSPEPDALERFRDLGQFDFVASQPRKYEDEAAQQDEEDEGLDFQLFAAPKTGGEAKTAKPGETHKIRLRSPSLDPEKVGFVRPHRDQSYYFADTLSEAEKQRLEGAALTGSQILARATSSWPGSTYDWKVLALPPSGLSKHLRLQQRSCLPRLTGDDAPLKKRTRPGKKYRIKIRRKAEAAKAKKHAKEVADEAKEAAEREKRTRRNREKKVKRKAKEKAKKVGGDGEEDGVVDDEV